MYSFFGIKERVRERNYRPALHSLIICSVQPNRVNSGFSGINGNLEINLQKIYFFHLSTCQSLRQHSLCCCFTNNDGSLRKGRGRRAICILIFFKLKGVWGIT